MEDRKQELYNLIADSVREIPEGQEAEPGSIVIETAMTKAKVQQAINDLGKSKGAKMEQNGSGQKPTLKINLDYKLPAFQTIPTNRDSKDKCVASLRGSNGSSMMLLNLSLMKLNWKRPNKTC